jgi:hypothetical protein
LAFALFGIRAVWHSRCLAFALFGPRAGSCSGGEFLYNGHFRSIINPEGRTFIGHYGVSFAAKRYSPQTSLGTLFLSVQLLDVLFSIFVLLGVEKLRIVPGFTAYNPYDLVFMPYSHSLVASIVWAVVAGSIMAAFRGRTAGLWVGIAVFSHFVFDVPMHTRDLPLAGNDSVKIGLGLWNYRYLSLAAELVVLGLGFWIYWRGLAATITKRTPAIVFAAILVVLTLATPFMPAPSSDRAFGWQALFLYFALAAAAVWVDRRMRPPVAASEAPDTETLEDAWKTHKATKQDLTDAEKTAFEAARDSTKQVLAISTGIIALTITFAKDFIGSGAPGRWLALVAWFLFLASSFFGLWALNALTGSAGQLKPTTWLSIRTKNIKRPAKWQVLTFIPALLLTVVYGTVASLTAPRVTTAIRDDSLRHDAMRAVAEARILALAKARFDSLRAAPDSEATVLLSHLATVGGARLQLRDRITPALDDSIRSGVDTIVSSALSLSPTPPSVTTVQTTKKKDQPTAVAPSPPRVVRASAVSAALVSRCPMFPLC